MIAAGQEDRVPRQGGNRPQADPAPAAARHARVAIVGRDGRSQDQRRFAYRHERSPRRNARAPQRAPASLTADFLPEPNAAAGIAKQIKASGRAYPVFGTSKLFLERPERHRVRVTSADPAVPLFQVGDGPIKFDRAERGAQRVFLRAR